MATYKRCDKCNKSTEDERIFISEVTIVIKDTRLFDNDKRVTEELCDDCIRTIVNDFSVRAGKRLQI